MSWTESELDDAQDHARAVGYAEFSPFVRDCVNSEIARSKAAGYPYPPPIIVSQRRVERHVRRVQLAAARQSIEAPHAQPLPLDDDDDETG